MTELSPTATKGGPAAAASGSGSSNSRHRRSGTSAWTMAPISSESADRLYPLVRNSKSGHQLAQNN